MRTSTGRSVELSDYEPTPYLATHVALRFELDPTRTRVTATTRYERREGASGPLVLAGEDLELEAVFLNGNPAEPETGDDVMRLNAPDDPFELTVVTIVDPSANTQLSGLYLSNGVYCTQCEAEGFRRITYFLDRPDVLARYDVEIVADREALPVQLSNGNPVQGDGVRWHDPHPKPSYLFALVAGRLDALRDTFETASGRTVDLAIYVEPGKSAMAGYAMDALKRSMRWDEERFGLEYDLDVFNIVAVSDFNMGAMENKGLNVFNDKYILADPDLATDGDYANIEAIVAHEYFHNWTGNRITCRDWFQLCLKEGLTVYRDQEFSSDMRSRAVERITQVQRLKAAQFPEDAGPLAHPVRPSAYEEINNFYTATVYQKGAELVRMLATLAGDDGFRAALDLYFERHDGEAATVEDFLACFHDACGVDTRRFKRWYEQAGTPQLRAEAVGDEIRLTQSYAPHLARQGNLPVVIPLLHGVADGTSEETQLLVMKDSEAVIAHPAGSAPASLLRDFSAPVDLAFSESDDDLAVRAAKDGNAFNRWDAMQRLGERVILAGYGGETAGSLDALVSAIARTAADGELEPAFRARCLGLPSEMDIAQRIGGDVDPDRVRSARRAVFDALSTTLDEVAGDILIAKTADEPYSPNADQAGRRALRNAVLIIRSEAGDRGAYDAALAQFEAATNMTDRFAALAMLVSRHEDRPEAGAALAAFRDRFAHEPLAIDKWLSLQAAMPGDGALERIEALARDATFTMENPNRVRSLVGVYASANLTGFHRADGRGYEFLADRLIELDDRNPQVAARIATAMRNFTIFDEVRRNHARRALERVAEKPTLSRDLSEIVHKILRS